VAELRNAHWQSVCFYSSPIGPAGSDRRAHADMLQESLVKPAIAAVDPRMTVVRSDELPSSSITASVVEHVVNSRLLIADLSFHNPNVFYEVGMRHGHKRPIVLISRDKDPIPANISDRRVIKVNVDATPAFVSEMTSRQEQIADHARWALSQDEIAERTR